MTDTAPTATSVWIQAARPKTLVASLIPVLVGSSVALQQDRFVLWILVACCVSAAAMQIGTNLANDALDYLGGVDDETRLGPERVTASGLLNARSVLAGTMISFAVAIAAGILLVARGGVPIVVIGSLSILAAWAYSAEPFSLAARGLGEAAAFVFYGMVAVTGTAYLHSLTWLPIAFYSALPAGALSAALMAVNNLRDIAGDRASGKRTLAVRLGAERMQKLFRALILLAFTAPLALMLLTPVSPAVLLSLLALPLGISLVQQVARASTGSEFNRALGATARLLTAHGLLLAVGIAW